MTKVNVYLLMVIMKKMIRFINVLKVAPLVNHSMNVLVVLTHMHYKMVNVKNVPLLKVNISILKIRNVRIVLQTVRLVIMEHLVQHAKG